jgi:hypothetical protein
MRFFTGGTKTVKLMTVALNFEIIAGRDLFLKLFDFRFTELNNRATLRTNKMVMVLIDI